MESQRVYVGGLTSDIKEADVIGRFKPFGAVTACEVIRGKSFSGDASQCRGFAYVSFQPKDQASLARAFSLVSSSSSSKTATAASAALALMQ
jgi:RNA recognition motif-containing protein